MTYQISKGIQENCIVGHIITCLIERMTLGSLGELESFSDTSVYLPSLCLIMTAWNDTVAFPSIWVYKINWIANNCTLVRRWKYRDKDLRTKNHVHTACSNKEVRNSYGPYIKMANVLALNNYQPEQTQQLNWSYHWEICQNPTINQINTKRVFGRQKMCSLKSKRTFRLVIPCQY